MDSSPVTSSPSSSTQEFLKAADKGNDRQKLTIAPMNSETSSLTSERPLAEIISERFPPFDSLRYIVNPFDVEATRDVMVDEEYKTMLLDAVIQTHAWASARFKRKARLECQKLEEQGSMIMNREKEQGMCSPTPSSAFSFSSSLSKLRYGAIGIVEKAREGLADFVMKMKMALAALNGLGP